MQHKHLFKEESSMSKLHENERKKTPSGNKKIGKREGVTAPNYEWGQKWR